MGMHLDGNTRDDGQPVALEAHDLLGIIGKKLDLPDAQIA
jgi:hypothetical protein